MRYRYAKTLMGSQKVGVRFIPLLPSPNAAGPLTFLFIMLYL